MGMTDRKTPYVSVHLTPDARDFYRLDRLYGDVPRETFGGDPTGQA